MMAPECSLSMPCGECVCLSFVSRPSHDFGVCVCVCMCVGVLGRPVMGTKLFMYVELVNNIQLVNCFVFLNSHIYTCTLHGIPW